MKMIGKLMAGAVLTFFTIVAQAASPQTGPVVEDYGPGF